MRIEDKSNSYKIKKTITISFISHFLYLVSSRISLGLSGILFWWAAARVYSIEEIGVGAVLISVASFLVFLSCLGITSTFLRFLPGNKEKREILETFSIFSLILLLLFSFIFLTGLDFFSPKLIFLRSPYYFLFFLVFVVSMQICQILDSFFIAFKLTNIVLFKGIIQNFSRILFLFLLLPFGGFGIFSSNSIAGILAIVVSVIYFVKTQRDFRINLKMGIKTNMPLFKKLLPFSLTNFLSTIPLNLPGMVFPIIILSLFSAKETGLFYIPWMIFLTYSSLINYANSIFLMKVSYGEDIKKLFRLTLFICLALGAIGSILFICWGDKILLVFSKDIAQGSLVILKTLFYSIFFFITNQIYITLLNIKKDVLRIGLVSGLMVAGIIIFSFLFIPKMKIDGIAYAWLISNAFVSGYIIIDVLLQKTYYINILKHGRE